MGREMRMVPENWEHPRNEDGNLIPLRKPEAYERDARDHRICAAAWLSEEGGEYAAEHGQYTFAAMMRYKRGGGQLECAPIPGTTRWSDGWTGPRPMREDYMPDWPASERTHCQMYETCTEGTPISPVFASPEELARWLTDTGASAFGDMTATHEEWLAACRCGTVSAAIVDGALVSGAALAHRQEQR